ncbi:DUF1643 domain-containing protein [Lactococcus lactis subsp. lactis]|jgi:hypothetical protein|uniref:DUF1643 domain-containing protein n=1 Tax=Lactococcus lactis TaxID=1358 RepID=UPI00155F41BB|nr:DUF1643 domain-containing protein [Lactococcus lactis]MCT3137839.1 DUF1643 domain-containing protein [Lactococcus lactis]NRD17263.1 DUF1643 domain-containing protein [Lactococcus lactis subsp. lactis]
MISIQGLKGETKVSSKITKNIQQKGGYEFSQLDTTREIECLRSSQSKKFRYYLKVPINTQNKVGKDIIIAIGMNPSSADEKTSDKTVNQLIKHASRKGYSTLIMLNSLPYYESDSKKLPNVIEAERNNFVEFSKILKRNIEVIGSVIKDTKNHMLTYDIFLGTGDPVIKEGAESIHEIEKILDGMDVFSTNYNKKNFTSLGYMFHPSRKNIEKNTTKRGIRSPWK